MKIEINEPGNSNFYKELFYVSRQYKMILKKPERKLTDIFRILLMEGTACIVLFTLLLIMGRAWGMENYMIVLMILMAFTAIVCYSFYIYLSGKMLKMMKEDPKAVLTLDENGIRLEKNEKDVSMAWDEVAFVRIGEDALCFLPKNGRHIIGVSREYEDQIREFIPVKIYE